MPDEVPHFTEEEISSFSNMPYYEIAYHVSRKFLIGQIEDSQLLAITRDAYDFDIPLEHVCDKKYIMRLDQGPTASFKDFAARMMGRLMQHILKQQNQRKIFRFTNYKILNCKLSPPLPIGGWPLI